MKRSVIVIIVLVLVGLFIYFSVRNTYNNMVAYNEGVAEQWSQVENVYQRRADLIPNLVNTVKGYAEFERETLTQVIEARSKATSINVDANNLNPAMFQQFQQAQGELSSALSRLLVTIERYPDLKANQNFLDLQAQLEGTENRISTERRKFNQVTRNYNTYIKKFPQVMFANMFGFESKPYFEAQQGAEEAPVVEF
jgi:LemA protein